MNALLPSMGYPFVLVDALVIRVREGDHVVPRSVLVATGSTEQGYREILGMQVGISESEASWSDFFARRCGRSLQGVDLPPITDAPDLPTARLLLQPFLTTYQQRAPGACAKLATAFDDITAAFALPAPYRLRLRTTNSQERLNQELRRRERIIRIFASTASALLLLGALLSEDHEQGATGKRYFDRATYHCWKARPVQQALPLFA